MSREERWRAQELVAHLCAHRIGRVDGHPPLTIINEKGSVPVITFNSVYLDEVNQIHDNQDFDFVVQGFAPRLQAVAHL